MHVTPTFYQYTARKPGTGPKPVMAVGHAPPAVAAPLRFEGDASSRLRTLPALMLASMGLLLAACGIGGGGAPSSREILERSLAGSTVTTEQTVTQLSAGLPWALSYYDTVAQTRNIVGSHTDDDLAARTIVTQLLRHPQSPEQKQQILDKLTEKLPWALARYEAVSTPGNWVGSISDDDLAARTIITELLEHAPEQRPVILDSLDKAVPWAINHYFANAQDEFFKGSVTDDDMAARTIVSAMLTYGSPEQKQTIVLNLKTKLPWALEYFRQATVPERSPLNTITDDDLAARTIVTTMLRGEGAEAERQQVLDLFSERLDWAIQHYDQLITNPPGIRDVGDDDMAARMILVELMNTPQSPEQEGKILKLVAKHLPWAIAHMDGLLKDRIIVGSITDDDLVAYTILSLGTKHADRLDIGRDVKDAANQLLPRALGHYSVTAKDRMVVASITDDDLATWAAISTQLGGGTEDVDVEQIAFDED